MRKTLLLAVAVLASAIVAPGASAFDNLAVGDIITGTNTGGIGFGSFITCNSSAFSGTVTSNPGTDLGGTADLTTVMFGNCGAGNSYTANNLPWTWSVDGAGNGTMTMDVTQVVSGVSCRVAGTVSFAYDAADWGGSGDMPVSGSLTFVSGSPVFCGRPVSGTYNVVGPNGVIDL